MSKLPAEGEKVGSCLCPPPRAPPRALLPFLLGSVTMERSVIWLSLRVLAPRGLVHLSISCDGASLALRQHWLKEGMNQ